MPERYDSAACLTELQGKTTIVQMLCDGWEVADLQLPHWQRESAVLVKDLRRYEKYLWRVDVSEQSIVIDLPETFEAWLATLSRRPRNHARHCVRRTEEGLIRFEILGWVVFSRSAARRKLCRSATATKA